MRDAGHAAAGSGWWLRHCSSQSVLFAVPIAPVASAADCSRLPEVIFARGTDEPPGLGRVGDTFVDALRKRAAGMSTTPTVNLQRTASCNCNGGDGAEDAISHQVHCVAVPDTKIVLGGFSQGASVIDIVAVSPMGSITWGSALPAQYADNIAAVATFGNVVSRTGGSLPTRAHCSAPKTIDL